MKGWTNLRRQTSPSKRRRRTFRWDVFDEMSQSRPLLAFALAVSCRWWTEMARATSGWKIEDRTECDYRRFVAGAVDRAARRAGPDVPRGREPQRPGAAQRRPPRVRPRAAPLPGPAPPRHPQGCPREPSLAVLHSIPSVWPVFFSFLKTSLSRFIGLVPNFDRKSFSTSHQSVDGFQFFFSIQRFPFRFDWTKGSNPKMVEHPITLVIPCQVPRWLW